jgi:hypothetical protein
VSKARDTLKIKGVIIYLIFIRGDQHGILKLYDFSVHILCQCKLLQITTEEIGWLSMRAATNQGSEPRVYCHRSIQNIVHCVGDVIMPTRYSSYCVILDTLSQPYILG